MTRTYTALLIFITVPVVLNSAAISGIAALTAMVSIAALNPASDSVATMSRFRNGVNVLYAVSSSTTSDVVTITAPGDTWWF